jgi:hypothetical protein
MRIFRVFSVCFALLVMFSAAAAAEKDSPKPENAAEEATFDLKEISVFERSDQESRYSLGRGQYVGCEAKPFKEVKKYPPLKSKRPLYGVLKCGFNPLNSTAAKMEFYFVLDESGEEPKAEKKAEKKPDSPLIEGIKELLGTKPPAETPLTQCPLSRYDRLYFDLNCDLDLTNDPVVMPLEDAPWASLPPWPVEEKMAFAYLNLDFDYGPGVGVKPFRVFPWLSVSEKGESKTMHFVAASARQGRIDIAKRQYDALLAQPYFITGRFDPPSTGLYLKPLNPLNRIESYGFESDSLMAMHRIDGQLYSISASPLGDKLIVKPYRGDFGTFAVGPGKREIKDISLQGSLRSQTASLGFGPDRANPGKPGEKVKECKLPVGDYLPSYLSIEYGRLSISISDNYHADGKPRAVEQPRVYCIKIEKDKTCVLDFSNKPEVLFASPAKEQTFKPGDEIKVSAVLVDPKLDIMIRRLDDTTRKKKETIKYGDGQETSYERALSLDPLVTIANSAGKKVAEGVMPFG